MADQTEQEPIERERYNAEAEEAYRIAMETPRPDILTAMHDGTLTTDMVFEWALHPAGDVGPFFLMIYSFLQTQVRERDAQIARLSAELADADAVRQDLVQCGVDYARRIEAERDALQVQVDEKVQAFDDECGRHEQTLIGKRGFADLVAQLCEGVNVADQTEQEPIDPIAQWEYAERYLWTDSESLTRAGRLLAARLRERDAQIARLSAQVKEHVQGLEDWIRIAARDAGDATARINASAAEIETLRAERDAAQQQIATLTAALTDLCDAIPDDTVAADRPLGVWLNAARAALSTRPQEQP